MKVIKRITSKHSRVRTVELSFLFSIFKFSRMHINMTFASCSSSHSHYMILIIKKTFNEGIILKAVA